jgi:hypothetical protein
MEHARDYRLDLLNRSDAEIDEVFNYSLSLIDGELRENVHAAKVMHYYHAGRVQQCKAMVDRWFRENPAACHDMVAVAALLKNDFGQAGSDSR